MIADSVDELWGRGDVSPGVAGWCKEAFKGSNRQRSQEDRQVRHREVFINKTGKFRKVQESSIIMQNWKLWVDDPGTLTKMKTTKCFWYLRRGSIVVMGDRFHSPVSDHIPRSICAVILQDATELLMFDTQQPMAVYKPVWGGSLFGETFERLRFKE